MIYQLGDDIIECARVIRHFFRKLFCKEYYRSVCGEAECNEAKMPCKWYWCPKKEGDNK